MSIMNVIYPTKSIFKDIISSIFPRVYNQLPLANVVYPFAVFEMTFVKNSPGINLTLTIDLWNNGLKLIEFDKKVDKLIGKLDYINNLENNLSVHFGGNIDVVRDVSTNEESLNRKQIIGTYNVYKTP